jgi:hypothetical protein
VALLGGANAYLDPLAERAPDARGAHPLWARCNDERDTRYSLGVEEELMLLNPGQWSLAQSSDQVIARLSDELSRHTSPETQAAVVELTTGVHADVDGVVAEPARRFLAPDRLAATRRCT